MPKIKRICRWIIISAALMLFNGGENRVVPPYLSNSIFDKHNEVSNGTEQTTEGNTAVENYQEHTNSKKHSQPTFPINPSGGLTVPSALLPIPSAPIQVFPSLQIPVMQLPQPILNEIYEFYRTRSPSQSSTSAFGQYNTSNEIPSSLSNLLHPISLFGQPQPINTSFTIGAAMPKIPPITGFLPMPDLSPNTSGFHPGLLTAPQQPNLTTPIPNAISGFYQKTDKLQHDALPFGQSNLIAGTPLPMLAKHRKAKVSMMSDTISLPGQSQAINTSFNTGVVIVPEFPPLPGLYSGLSTTPLLSNLTVSTPNGTSGFYQETNKLQHPTLPSALFNLFAETPSPILKNQKKGNASMIPPIT